jgi:uncharacterized protein YjeT (DUF2065 family)
MHHSQIEEISMKPLALAGLVLIGLGIAGLVFGQYSYTTEKAVIDVGPITATVDEKHSIDIPEIAGIGAILAGAMLIYLGRKTT